MNAVTAQQLWQRLQDHALVDGAMPQGGAPASPWYVRVMLGVAGWIAALFLLGFVAAAFSFVMKSATASLLLGAAGCGAALVIFRVVRDHDFGAQFGMALSFAAQALFIIGLGQALKFDSASGFFLVAAFEAALAVLAPNFIHRVLTSFAAVVALSFALGRLGLHGITPGLVAAGFTMVFLDEQRWSAHAAIVRPIGYGLALALLYFDAFQLWGHEIEAMVSPARPDWLLQYSRWIGIGLVAAIFLGAVLRLLACEGVAASSTKGIAAILAAILVGAVSFAAPGAATALLILLLGFATGNPVLTGLGLFALGGFVSHYYYQLQATLLFKSMVLAISGSLLLLAGLVLKKWLAPSDAKENPDA